jgi:hypothetical protein
MKATFRKLSTLNTASVIRNFFLYLIVTAIFIGTLYVLITSPA